MNDAFEVFAIEPRFEIDLPDLERRHRRWLAELHPNRRSTPALELPQADPSFAKQGEIQAAYRQLRDPVSRAELLFERRGQRPTLVQSPELLARIFEQREAMEQALIHGDTEQLSACLTGARARHVELQRVLAAHFARDDARTGEVPIEINTALQELRYLNKIVQRGEQAMDELA